MAGSAYAKAFGSRVRSVREERGYSQEKLAAISGLHRTAVTHVERATRAPTIDTIAKLARALDVQPSELMPPLDLRRSGRGSGG